MAGLWGTEFSALSGGVGTLIVVLAVAAVPAVRNFQMGREPTHQQDRTATLAPR